MHPLRNVDRINLLQQTAYDQITQQYKMKCWYFHTITTIISKIITTMNLPYALDDFDSIQENESIVDMIWTYAYCS